MTSTTSAAEPQAARRSKARRPGQTRAEVDFKKRWHSNRSYTYHALLGVIQAEHGNAGLPDNRDSRNMLIVIADLAWHFSKEPVIELQRLVPTIAPWCDFYVLIDYVEVQAEKRGRALTAKEASALIGFTYERWKRAPRKPFDPCDKTPGQMAAIRRKKDAVSARARRARQKAERAPKPTPELVKHLMATHGISRRTAYRWIEAGGERRIIVPKPKAWEVFGCSRAAWYRRQKAARDETADGTKPVVNGETVGGTNPVVEPEHNQRHEPDFIDVSSGETVFWHKTRRDLSVFLTKEAPTGGESVDVAPTDAPPDGLGGHRRLEAEQADGKEVVGRAWETCGRPILIVNNPRVDREEEDTREVREYDAPRLPSWTNISDRDERRRAIFAQAEAELRAFDAAEHSMAGRAA